MKLTETKQEMSSELQDMMINKEFVGQMHENIDHSEYAIMSLIDTQMLDLQKELKEAKLEYADASLQDENWSAKYNCKMACKILLCKISLLTELKRDIDKIFTPILSSN